MMNSFDKPITMPFWVVVLVVILLTVGGVVAGLFTIQNATAVAVLGGLLGGLVVYAISFLTDIGRWRQLDRFNRMGIKDILSTRHQVTYYGPIVSRARTEVLVMGTSCHRFINDFMDDRSDDKVLLDQLRKHIDLTVRILIPTAGRMDDESRAKFDLVKEKLRRVMNEFPGRVELRRFDDVARLSMVMVDEELITGPVFPGIESRQSPAVHVDRRTEYGTKFKDFFDDLWDKSASGSNS